LPRQRPGGAMAILRQVGVVPPSERTGESRIVGLRESVLRAQGEKAGGKQSSGTPTESGCRPRSRTADNQGKSRCHFASSAGPYRVRIWADYDSYYGTLATVAALEFSLHHAAGPMSGSPGPLPIRCECGRRPSHNRAGRPELAFFTRGAIRMRQASPTASLGVCLCAGAGARQRQRDLLGQEALSADGSRGQ
jgi:hypothetical protein